jgi:NTE family protein
MSEAKTGKKGLVLSGGGANGAFEVGVMKALCTGHCGSTGYEPLNAEVFTGTSIGAYNAAFMISQPGRAVPQTVCDLEKAWLEILAENRHRCGNGVFRFRGDPLHFLNRDCLANQPLKPFAQLASDGIFFAQDWVQRGTSFLQSAGPIENRVLSLFDLSGFVSTEPQSQMLKETLSLEGIRRSDKILKILTTNWKTGELNIFEKEHMTEAVGHKVIMASAALPGIFPPVDIEGDWYVDGGVLMNTPVMPAIEAGADVIHMTYLDPDVKNIPFVRLRNTLDVLDRMLTIQFAIKINEDLQTVERVNRALEVLEGGGKAGSVGGADQATLCMVMGRTRKDIQYRKITVHRYHPREDLSGLLGLLQFDRKRLADLVEAGFKNAVEHDCQVSGCIVPAQ